MLACKQHYSCPAPSSNSADGGEEVVGTSQRSPTPTEDSGVALSGGVSPHGVARALESEQEARRRAKARHKRALRSIASMEEKECDAEDADADDDDDCDDR